MNSSSTVTERREGEGGLEPPKKVSVDIEADALAPHTSVTCLYKMCASEKKSFLGQ